jgi:hypothetical protein
VNDDTLPNQLVQIAERIEAVILVGDVSTVDDLRGHADLITRKTADARAMVPGLASEGLRSRILVVLAGVDRYMKEAAEPIPDDFGPPRDNHEYVCAVARDVTNRRFVRQTFEDAYTYVGEALLTLADHAAAASGIPLPAGSNWPRQAEAAKLLGIDRGGIKRSYIIPGKLTLRDDRIEPAGLVRLLLERLKDPVGDKGEPLIRGEWLCQCGNTFASERKPKKCPACPSTDITAQRRHV